MIFLNLSNTLVIIDYSFVFDFVYSGKIEGIEGIHLYGYILKEIDIYIYTYIWILKGFMMGGEIITRPKPAEASRRNDGNWIRGSQ